MAKRQWLAVLAMVAAAPAVAQTGEAARLAPGQPTLLNLSAEASVEGAPDYALFSAGVVTAAGTAQAAMEDNARRMAAVVVALKAAGVEPRDIQTQGLSLQPQYVYDRPVQRSVDLPQPERPPRIAGYQASNTVSVRARDLSKIGRVLDALVAAGANQINGPQFLLADPDAALDSARTVAMRKAIARAQLYATAAGLRVRNIVSVSENGMYAPPPVLQTAGWAAAPGAPPPPPPPPIAPGQVSTGITLSVQFALER